MTMSKRIGLALLLVCLAAQAFAQDIIHTTDQRTVEAKVIEIGEENIRYKLYINPEGPDFILSLNKVDWIDFQNGTHWQAAAAGVRESAGQVEADEEEVLEEGEGFGPLSYRWGRFYGEFGPLYDDEMDYIGFSLYGSEYLKAANRYAWGEWLTVGGALTLASVILMNSLGHYVDAIPNMHGMEYTYSGNDSFTVAGTLIGLGCVGAGIPLWISGNRGLSNIADDYNQHHAGTGASARQTGRMPFILNLGNARNGFGFYLSF